MTLKTIDERIIALLEKKPILKVATYNMLLKEYYKEYEGLDLPIEFLNMPSAESITRCFREHKITNRIKEKEFIEELQKLKSNH